MVASSTAPVSTDPEVSPVPAATTARSKTSAAPSPRAKPTTPNTLQFSATTTDGKSFDGASLVGKPVLLWFWAPWCPTCRRELPEVERLAKQYDGEVQVVGIGSLDSAKAISQFAERTSGFTAQLLDEQGSVWKHFAVTQQSSLVLLDSDGRETFRAGYGGSPDLAGEVATVAGRK